jgi:hypothetical protein
MRLVAGEAEVEDPALVALPFDRDFEVAHSLGRGGEQGERKQSEHPACYDGQDRASTWALAEVPA